MRNINRTEELLKSTIRSMFFSSHVSPLRNINTPKAPAPFFLFQRYNGKHLLSSRYHQPVRNRVKSDLKQMPHK